ncbi:MAG: cation transporter [Gammaproteobacteria bacterium]|nr:cation transporter [Gammaproteobacteria bacterium]
MQECCDHDVCDISVLHERQRRVLKWVLAINAVMFVVEIVAGILANSTALLADSLDMLGDALIYGFSIYVLTRGDLWKARSALLKGSIMLASALFVYGEAIYKITVPVVPIPEAIGVVGLLALLANVICLMLLSRHRADDINMHSVWLCSRNDIIANVGVLIAAVGVGLTHTIWPDILIGLMIATIVLRSAVQVIVRSVKKM